MSTKNARAAIARARKQLQHVQEAAWDPQDADDAVTWAFYAYENCVVALAEATGTPWKKTHWSKVDIARQMASDGRVARDIGDELENLNELRKDVQYGEPGADLLEVDLEYLAVELERYVDNVAAVVERANDV